MKINIFNSNKQIDLDKLIDTRALICANSGGGKSYAVRKILEESNGEVMSIVLDTEGEFNTLREKYNFLLIGENGDVDLSLDSANILPRKLLQLNVPTIIDISELKMNERVKYVKSFLEGLMDLKYKDGLWKPCLIIIDEIHRYAGQQEKQDSCAAVIDLATRGRKRGYCLIGCTQRISKLHKDVVAELNNYGGGRTSLDLDMKRTADILGFSSRQQMLSLRDLKEGEFYFFGPAISNKVEKEQIALCKTTHPKRGMDVQSKINKPNDKIYKILEKISELPKKAKDELKEIADYKVEIVRLKKELSKKPIPQPVVAQKLPRMIHVDDKEYLSKIKILERNSGLSERKLKDIAAILGKKVVFTDKERSIGESVPETRAQSHATNSMQIVTSDQELGKCPRVIYSLLFTNAEKDFTKPQIGLLTGYSHTSGGFSNALASLNSMGLIVKNGDRIKIGEVIAEYATETGLEFKIDNLKSKMGRCIRELFEVLLEHPGIEFSKQELASHTPSDYSYTSGGFSNALAKLNTLELIKRNGTLIKLNEDIMELLE